MKKLGAWALIALVFCFSVVADEVRLANGDVLHGQVLCLRDDILTLRTPHMGSVAIDWKQVCWMATDKPLRVLVLDRDDIWGRVSLTDREGKIIIIADEWTLLERSELYALQDDDDNCIEGVCAGVAVCKKVPVMELVECCDEATSRCIKETTWSGEVSLGFVNLEGNRNETTWDGEIDAVRQTTIAGFDAYKLDFEGKFRYRTQSRAVKTDQGRIRILYEYNFTPKWVWRASEEAYWDIAEDINIRWETCTDIGYYFWKGPDLLLQVYLGLAHANIHYSQLTAQQKAAGTKVQKPDLKAFYYDSGWEFRWKIFTWLTFAQEFQYSPRVSGFDSFWIESFQKLEVPIGDHWKLVLENDYYYDSDPSPGLLPQDLTWEVKLAYTF